MKAMMYLGDQAMELRDIPKPEGEFIVRVLGTTVCGTDLKTWLKGHPAFPPPAVLGHEAIGRVEKAPKDSGFAPGDYCVAAPYGECGECEICRQGLEEMCENKHFVPSGMFCEYISVPLPLVSRGVIKLPEPRKAFALTEPLACVLCGAEKIQLTPDSRLVVAGGGPMGALFAMLGMSRGCRVMVSEPNPLRREALSGWGIPARAPEEVSFGEYDRAVVAVNIPEAASQVISGVGKGARVNLFAGFPKGSMIRLDPAAVHYRGVCLTGSSGYALRHFQEAFRLIARETGRFEQLITHEFPLEKTEEAFRLLAEGRAFKTLIRP